MSVDLEPTELGFRRPFNREVSQILRLRNSNKDPIAFKVKTTAPKHYCVRPNSGRIEAGKHVEVQVLLQAMKEEPPLDAKCKDKFLVQSVAITEDTEFSNITSIFEKAARPAIQERKIRVNFLPAEVSEEFPATPQHGNEPNGVVCPHCGYRMQYQKRIFDSFSLNQELPDEDPPAYTSPSTAYETPAAALSKKFAENTFPTSTSDHKVEAEQEAFLPPSGEIPNLSAAESAAGDASGTIPSVHEELRAQLARAQMQIQNLRDKLANQAKNAKSPMPVLQQQSQPPAEMGVPVPIAAGLCLLSFLLAYFFF